MNIVRASRNETLDFIAVSKYTGSGTLGLTSNALTRASGPSGGAFPNATVGPNNIVATAGNSFDLSTLENREFYTGILRPLSLPELDLILRSSLPRELIFHVILDSVKVVLADGKSFRFYNDPTDDTWTDETIEPLSPHCEALTNKYTAIGGSGFQPAFVSSAWLGIHERDCRYQKFLYFLGLALIYGLNTEAKSFPNPAAKTDKSQPATITQIQLCLDPSLAQNKIISASLRCGSTVKRGEGQFVFFGGGVVKSIEPVWRSSYAAFRYFGKLLATGTIERVRLDAGLPSLTRPGDPRILTIVSGGVPCFTQLTYGGQYYCVPNEGAVNTKEVFTLLSTLVALSTSQSALPVTQSVILSP